MISLIIPTFNSSKTIRACLDSIFKSTLLPSEIIVVDDKSSDETVSIIENLLSSKVKINLIKKKMNSGPAIARNIGAKNAINEYIFFADSDTRLNNDAIEIAYETIQKRGEEISAVVGIYNENQSQGIIAEFKTFYYLFQMGRKGIIDYDAFSASCAIIRKEDFFKVGGI
ncbi:glycosyltransferase [Prochlorococcus sp. AH-716-B04]|nr:glycosyltransferase [Prochlorococcus sp. AH-716-B04]